MTVEDRIDAVAATVKRARALGIGLPGCTDMARAFQGEMRDEDFRVLVDATWDSLSPHVAGSIQKYPDVAGSIPMSPEVSVCSSLSPLGAGCSQMSPLGSALSEECRRNVAALVSQFVERHEGEFTVRTVDEYCGFKPDDRKARTAALNRLERQGKIARLNNKVGIYRTKYRDSDDEDGMDIENVSVEEFPLILPFGLNDIVEVYPKEIILIAGETNGGKTSIIFWILWHTLCSSLKDRRIRVKQKFKEEIYGNLPNGDIPLVYLSSEMGRPAVARKVQELTYLDNSSTAPVPMLFDGETGTPIANTRWWWNRCIVSREIGDKPIQDIVAPNGVNAIDYLEVNSEGDFAKMGCTVAEVFKALDNGVAIIATQKRKNSAYGVGGEGMKEKPRLSLTILDNQERGFSTLVISKAKHYRDWNPTGLQFDFKVTHRGGKIVPISGKWMRSSEIEPLRKAPNYGQNNY